MTAAARGEDRSAGTAGRALLFLVVLAYYWITLTPFHDLGLASTADPWAGSSNTLNQIFAIVLFCALAVAVLRHPLLGEVVQPRLLLGALLAWFLLTAMLADDPATALRRVVMAGMIIAGASIFLLLPRDERHFARLLGIGLLLLLALAYWGVIFWPARAIHHITDVVEPQLDGLWRGFFSHKNAAAEAMAFMVFAGLFVRARWSRLAGSAIVVLALVFLWQTGGKTALAMLPLILLLAFVFERRRGLRMPMVVGGLLLFNLAAIGSAVFPSIGGLLDTLGIDASFTDRTDIWQQAFSAIMARPFTGYGFQSYWQTESLVYGGGTLESWAVLAANAHNAYLEAMINAGVPGLVLVVAWLVFRPLGDIARAEAVGNDPLLTRLFMRIWLYGIFAATFESSFFNNAGPIWFFVVMAVFGLRYQARARAVPAPLARMEVAHA